MKKRVFFIFLTMVLVLFMSSCKLCDYIAYITIYNEGEFPIFADVEGSEVTLNPGQYSTWDIILDSDVPTLVELYAELAGDDSYYDTKTVTVQDGDVYLWPVGWYAAAGKIVRGEKKK